MTLLRPRPPLAIIKLAFLRQGLSPQDVDAAQASRPSTHTRAREVCVYRAGVGVGVGDVEFANHRSASLERF